MEQIQTQQQIEHYLKVLISKEIGCHIEEIKATNEFIKFGIDSIKGIALLYQIERKLELDLNPMIFWDYPTIQKMSIKLAEMKMD